MSKECPKVELIEKLLVLNFPNSFKEENEKPSILDLKKKGSKQK